MLLYPLPILIVEDDGKRVDKLSSWLPKEHFRFVWASSPGAALGVLERDRGDVLAGIMLDHDLDRGAITPIDRTLSGRTIVKAVVSNISRNVPVFIHSNNQDFPRTMEDQLVAAGFVVERVPYRELTQAEFLNWLEYVRETRETLTGWSEA